MRYGIQVNLHPMIDRCVMPLSGYPVPSTAYERISNGAFVPPSSEWSVTGTSWSIEELNNATHNGSATDTLSQTLDNPLESERFFRLTFDVTSASTEAYSLQFYQDATPVQTVANQVLGVGSHSFSGIVSGAANIFIVTPQGTGGGAQVFDNFSLLV